MRVPSCTCRPANGLTIQHRTTAMQKADGLRLFQINVCLWFPLGCGGHRGRPFRGQNAFLLRHHQAQSRGCRTSSPPSPSRQQFHFPSCPRCGHCPPPLSSLHPPPIRQGAARCHTIRPRIATDRPATSGVARAPPALPHPSPNSSFSVTFCGGGGIRGRNTCGRRYGGAGRRPSRLPPAQSGSIPPRRPSVRSPSAPCRRHHLSVGALSSSEPSCSLLASLVLLSPGPGEHVWTAPPVT